MKNFVWIIILIASSSFAADGKIVFLKGEVLLNGKTTTLKAPISFGDKVITKKEALAVIKMNKNAVIKIKQNTELSIPLPKKDNKKTTNVYSLIVGEIFIKANQKKNETYQVKTKNTIMGVRGTQFFISSGKDKNVWMCVNEGKVAVSINGQEGEVLVREGEGVVINSNRLPKVKQYAWTKKLNWKLNGNYEELKDETNIQNLNYDLENFNYD